MRFKVGGPAARVGRGRGDTLRLLLEGGQAVNYTRVRLDTLELRGGGRGTDVLRAAVDASRFGGGRQSVDFSHAGADSLRFEGGKRDHVCAKIEEKRLPAGEPVTTNGVRVGLEHIR